MSLIIPMAMYLCLCVLLHLVGLSQQNRGVILVDEHFEIPSVSTDEATTWIDAGGDTREWKIPKSTTHGKLKRTAVRDISSSLGEITDIEGSGDNEYEETVTYIFITEEDKVSQDSNLTTVPDVETSSRGMPTRKLSEISLLQNCLNMTCDPKFMSILPRHKEKIPTGSNLTFQCSGLLANNSNILWWFDIINNVTIATSNEGKLNLPLIHLRENGQFACLVMSDEYGCCHQKLDVYVFDVPDYRVHLGVLGGIIAVGLVLCFLIGLTRRAKMKKVTKSYEVKMELRSEEKPTLL